jgi:hypothetical protein
LEHGLLAESFQISAYLRSISAFWLDINVMEGAYRIVMVCVHVLDDSLLGGSILGFWCRHSKFGSLFYRELRLNGVVAFPWMARRKR